MQVAKDLISSVLEIAMDHACMGTEESGCSDEVHQLQRMRKKAWQPTSLFLLWIGVCKGGHL